jgi:hypothetical protein
LISLYLYNLVYVLHKMLHSLLSVNCSTPDLSQYHAYVEELADLYTQGQQINADQDPHTVFECIESMIVNPLPKKFMWGIETNLFMDLW